MEIDMKHRQRGDGRRHHGGFDKAIVFKPAIATDAGQIVDGNLDANLNGVAAMNDKE